MGVELAEGSETSVTFHVEGEELVGVYHTPASEGLLKGKAASAGHPGVVFLHGFTSNRMEDPVFRLGEGMFERAARNFARRGFASLRFDFRGHGESDGAFEDLALTHLIEDTLAAVGFLKAQPGIDGQRICLLGHSLGTLAAVCAAHRTAGISALALWHALPYPYQVFVELLGKDTVEQALREGRASFPWEDKGMFVLRSRFFEELIEISPLTEIAKFSRPVLFIYGSNDPYIQPQPYMGNAFERAHPGPHETLHMATDHTFSVRTRGTKILDQAIAVTAVAFERAVKA